MQSILVDVLYVAVGRNQWYHFGLAAPPSLVYFRGDWDVLWGYDLAFDPCVSPGLDLNFHVRKDDVFNFPLVVLKGIYHYWTCFSPLPGVLTKWKFIFWANRWVSLVDD